jgi:hypothetical protein
MSAGFARPCARSAWTCARTAAISAFVAVPTGFSKRRAKAGFSASRAAR